MNDHVWPIVVILVLVSFGFMIGAGLGVDYGRYDMYKAYKEGTIKDAKGFELKYQLEQADLKAEKEKDALKRSIR